MSIKERLAALNLSQEPAQANNDAPSSQATAGHTANKHTAGPAPAPGASDERRGSASASMQQKQATLTNLLRQVCPAQSWTRRPSTARGR